MERRGFFAAILGGLVAAVWPKRAMPSGRINALYHDRVFKVGPVLFKDSHIISWDGQKFVSDGGEEFKSVRFAGGFTLYGKR
jgi:hypothetical protein